jgi:hypothetical protein
LNHGDLPLPKRLPGLPAESRNFVALPGDQYGGIADQIGFDLVQWSLPDRLLGYKVKAACLLIFTNQKTSSFLKGEKTTGSSVSMECRSAPP